MRLFDYASNTYSQFGEDGMLAHIFDVIGVQHHTCIEFGASTGPECSNVGNLWTNDWQALLIEADQERAALLAEVANDNCTVLPVRVERSGPNSIDNLVPGDWPGVDLLSIDVDGEDYVIFHDMTLRPRVVCIEYNQSIPPGYSLTQKLAGDCFGSSASALKELAEMKNYTFLGLTKGNMIFLLNELAEPFLDYERDLKQLFDYDALVCVATDYMGRGVLVGPGSPWGLRREPYMRELIGLGTRLFPMTAEQERLAWEELYGPSIYIAPEFYPNLQNDTPKGRGLIDALVRSEANLIIIDVTQMPDCPQWIENRARGYSVRCGETLMVLVRTDLADRGI